jgi:hypothetical protein
MTRDEWEALQHVAFGEWWRSPLDAKSVDAWFPVVADFECVDVDRALQRLLRSSPRFAPRLGELLAELEPSAPGFDVVWQSIYRHLARHGADEPRRGLTAIAEDLQLGPVVAGWVAAYGWRRLCLAQVDDPEYGGAELHHLRGSFEHGVGESANHARLEAALDAELEKPDTPQLAAGEPRRLEPMRHLKAL